MFGGGPGNLVIENLDAGFCLRPAFLTRHERCDPHGYTIIGVSAQTTPGWVITTGYSAVMCSVAS